MESVDKIQGFVDKLDSYDKNNPLDLSIVTSMYKDMSYLELSEASRQVETKMENSKDNRKFSIFLMNLYADILGKLNILVPEGYDDHVDIDTSDHPLGAIRKIDPLDYPFGDEFTGIEYEAYLQLVPLLEKSDEMNNTEFEQEMDKVIDNLWGSITPEGFLEQKDIEGNRKKVISLIYDISPHKKFLIEVCRYIQENRPNDRGLSFVKFLVAWINEKKKYLEEYNNEEDEDNKENEDNKEEENKEKLILVYDGPIHYHTKEKYKDVKIICNNEGCGGCCPECLYPLIKDHPSYKDCDDNECMICSVRDCPHEEVMHYHHDGCPVCYYDEKVKAP